MTEVLPTESPRPVQAFGLAECQQLYGALGVEAHPILHLPTLDQVRALLAAPEGREQLVEHLRKRQDRIALAQVDPLNWAFEPVTWRDADRLLLECQILGIFGGNRAQKSYYAINRACQTAVTFPRSRVVFLAESETASIATTEVQVWEFLKPTFGHLNNKRAGDQGGIGYNQKTGFSGRKIVLPNGSEIYFLTYNQDPGDYEGWEFGARPDIYETVCAQLRAAGKFVPPNIGAMADESMKLAWLQMLARRVKYRNAKLLWPFTPVKGITPAIKEMVGAAASTVETRPAELLPRKNLPDCPEGHMPYVRKCTFKGAMAIYFHTVFNPFGPGAGRTYYDEIKALCAGKASEYVERVAYGYARDTAGRAFKNFGPWNIVKRTQLPAIGTNYKFTDPAGARNWATVWARVAPGNPPSIYFYRDWPDAQTYGEWAVPTERETNESTSRGWDGDPGPAQNSLGLGVTGYKKLFLGLEAVEGLTPEMDPQRRGLFERSVARKDPALARETIAERYVDPRAGRAEHIAEQGGTCIIDEFAEVQTDPKTGKVTGPAMDLIPASGVGIDEGMTQLNDLLEWNQEEPLALITNQPHLFVSEDCQQLIWMFENYTGRGGERGACKDFADLARYAALAKLEYVSEAEARGKAGAGF